jgi:amidase
MRAHTLLYRRFLEFMADYDALICPAMAVPPFPHAQLYVEAINGEPMRTYFHWLALAYGLTLTAHPVACIPCGRDHTGMPFGIQVCGRRFGDRRTLAIAAALEQHLQSIPELARPAAADRLRFAPSTGPRPDRLSRSYAIFRSGGGA